MVRGIFRRSYGHQAPVERASKQWLEQSGWKLVLEAGSWADVIAERAHERLIVA